MYKSKLLNNTYKILGLNFKINNINHLHIKSISKYIFSDLIILRPNETCIYNNFNEIDNTDEIIDSIIITKGTNEYFFVNVYEILLWYYFYSIKNKHIVKHSVDSPYFSKIPPYYRNIDPKKGLIIIKSALDQIIIKNNGIPKYFNTNILDHIFYIRKH